MCMQACLWRIRCSSFLQLKQSVIGLSVCVPSFFSVMSGTHPLCDAGLGWILRNSFMLVGAPWLEVVSSGYACQVCIIMCYNQWIY